MYLSRIEMIGFKSFADKTVIEFDRGMTAVVGPNGSGKSNLSEAIRWVLGEQSAKSLRGSRMEDVIFNGTQDRKPVNLAKVTLVLNNEDRYLDYDFSEISISRSYNRNGDSDYQINNETVRLKDVVDLFLDSGLGKNSFSIISQGQVEQIFLSKPEERRVIFEEAAGVQKYQYRKLEASRKLERSSDNLSRVKDIIYEINQQLTPLKKQRETALIYQEKKEILKDLEISLYTSQIAQYQKEYQQNERELKDLLSDLTASQTALEKANDSLDQKKDQQEQLTKTLDETTDRYQNAIQTIEQLRSRQQMTHQEIEFKSQQFDQVNQQIEEQKDKEIHSKSDKTLLMNDLHKKKAELSTIKEQIDQVDRQIAELVELEHLSQEDIQSRLIEAYQEQTSLTNRINQAKQDQINQELLQKKTKNDLEKDQSLEETLGQQLAELNTKAKQLEEVYQTQVDDYTQAQSELQTITETLPNLKNKLFQAERTYEQAKHRVDYLSQTKANYEGFYNGVRTIMKEKESLKGVIGPVSDILTVPKKYQIAIETALGSATQQLIVEDDQTAQRAISLLKSKRAGRATFLPLTNIKRRSLSPSLQKLVVGQPGYIATANEVVSVDSKYQAIIDYLLGITVIAETLPQAQQMAKVTGHRIRIVTLDGEVLMPGGSVTGGEQKNRQQSVFDRQDALKEAKVALQERQNEWQSLEKKWQEVNHRQQHYQAALNDKQLEIAQAKEAFEEVKDAASKAEQDWQQAKERIQIYQSERKTINETLENLSNDLKEASQKKEANDSFIEQMKNQMNQAQTSQVEIREQLTRIEEQRSEYLRQEAILSTESKQLEREAKRIQTEVDTILNTLENLTLQQTQYDQELEELKATEQDLTTQIDAYTQQDDYSMAHIESLRKERQQLNEAIFSIEKERDTLEAKEQQYLRQQATLEAQNEKYDSLMDHQLNYLNQEYQLSYELAQTMAQPLENREQAQRTIKEIRSQIDQLGPINLQAIEDYESLNERYQLLVQQEDDLVTAMKQLEETMAQMDVEVESRFGVTFKQINEQFKKTFKHLFMGGEASLELTDPDDLLTTGVDIIAQPPGKKKQNLSLLSGGERALTAIALLFAILEVKPVPFVILDEVEAALDDANVHRYGEYIQNFTLDTQFIVITHRKGTMEHADVLYGVTMERTGVSKLASVQLSEAVDVIGED